MATARPHVAPGTLDGIARQLDSLRRGLDADTVVVLCTERGATFEIDAELPDVPIGEVVHSTVRVQTTPSACPTCKSADPRRFAAASGCLPDLGHDPWHDTAGRVQR